VAGVGDQRDRVRRESEASLGGDEDDVDRNADGKCAAEVRGRVDMPVTMGVPMGEIMGMAVVGMAGSVTAVIVVIAMGVVVRVSHAASSAAPAALHNHSARTGFSPASSTRITSIGKDTYPQSARIRPLSPHWA
jgi:hypothetical protein